MADKNVFEDIVPIEGSTDAKKNVFADSVPLPERSPIKDLGLSLVKGGVDVGESALGVADVYSGGAAGNALEKAGISTKAAREAIDQNMSPAAQQDAQTVNDTKGFLPTVEAVARHPYYLGNVVAESIPSMAASVAVGRAAQKIAPGMSAAAAGGIGEGVVSAGQTAEQIRQDTGALDEKGTIGAVGSGAVVGLTGGAANVAARAAHVVLPTTMGLANRGLDKVEGNIAGRMVKAGAIEGAEEVVQSAVEQIGQNYGTGKPLDEGVAEQAAIGGMAGAAMGVVGGVQGHHAKATTDANPQREQNDPSVSVPVGPLQAAAAVGKTSGAVQDASKPVAPPDASQPTPAMGGNRGLIAEAAARNGVNPMTALTISSIETGGRFNPDAQNPRSSAHGMFQFMDATRKMFPEVTPEQWRDPKVQAEYGAKFIAATNARMQQTLGREPTPGEAYMGHLLGSYGATSLLTADPNTPVRDVVAQYDPKRADEIVRLNGMKDLTAGQAVEKWNSIAQQHAERLGLEQNAFPFTDRATAEMRVRDQAREGNILEVVDHPTVPGKFAALPAMGGDPNEAQRASKVPLVADLPRYDTNPNEPQAQEAVPQQPGLQAAAATPGGLAVPGEQSVQPGPAAAAVPAAQQVATQAAGASPTRDELIAQRGLVPGQDYNPNPTAGQAAAGNYKMAHEKWNGLDLSIENPVGSTRTSKDPAAPWSVDMSADYGYIKRTRAADSTEGKVDRVDFYKPMDAAVDAPVHVIDQFDPQTGKFDEHKVVFGVNSKEEAGLIYDQHFSDDSGPARRQDITAMSMPEFKAWLKGGNTDEMPAAQAAPQLQDAKAVQDGVLPPSLDFSGKPVEQGLFASAPEAAKFAADNSLAADPVVTPQGVALAPRVQPQELDEHDTQRVAALNSALQSGGFEPVTPLREAPSPAAALAAHVAQQAFGVKVIHTEENAQFSGVSYGDRVYLGAGEQHPVLAVAGHEVTHAFEGTQVHKDLMAAFEKFGINPKEQITNRQAEEQAQDGRPISRDYARNEVVADMNGSMWVDPKFWQALATHDDSLFRKVAYKFMELATKAVEVVRGSKFDASTIVKDVDGARAAIAQAWATHLNTKQSAKATGTTGEPLFQQSKIAPQQRDDNLSTFLSGSQVKQVMYHGTARDITQFRMKQAGATFVAPTPNIAEDFSQASSHWKAKNYLGELTPEQIAAAKERAIDDVQKAWEKGDLNDEAIDIEKAIRSDKAEENGMAMDYLEPHLKAAMPVGENIMPLHVRATNPFDYQNPEHVSAVAQKAGLNLTEAQRLKGGSWDVIESKPVQAAIKALGHDGFFVHEGGAKNLGVYNPGQLKSATGNRGTFDASNPDIRFAKKLEPISLPDKLAKALTVPEKAKLRRDVATRLVALFDQLPSANEMAAIAWSGKAARGWYADSARAISHVFGPDANRFTALLAAMSPQNSVQMNLQNAAGVWAGWVKAGRPTGRDEIIKVMGQNVVGNKLTDSVLDAWINNSVRALSTPNPEALVISGPKVNSFMQNLRGNVQEVTNDAWMAAFSAVDQKIFGGRLNAGGTDPGKSSGYLAMSAKVREAAQRISQLTGDAWTPAEVQETIWAWAKTVYEMQSEAEGGKGAREIISNGELRDELIAATPEFSSLLLDEKYAGKLRSAGYGQRLDDLRTLPSVGRGATATRGEKAPFAASTQRGHELAAAGRLERLRDQRARGEAATRAEGRGLPDAGGVRGGAGRVAFSRGQDQGDGRASRLEGLPATVQVDGRPVTFGPFEKAHDAARAYMEHAGLPYNPPTKYAKVDRARAERIAAAFDAMQHDPQNPEVKRAYDAMIAETTAQYEALMATGLKVEFIDFEKQGDPYGNPRNAILDVVNNNHMWVFSTRDGFGTSAFDPVDNPLLRDTPFKISGKTALANDLFRVVHDYFGHVKDGVGFRADGEENAWRSHSAMYSPLARQAMTTETRGQNSWLNFGPYGEANRTAQTADTHFADQKIGLLPMFAIDEGRTDADVKFARDAKNITHWDRKFNAVQKVFYSPLVEAISGKGEDRKLPGIGWKAEIKAAINKGAVKADEVKWSGVEEWLDMQQGKIEAKDVAMFVARNGIRIEEVEKVKREPREPRADELEQHLNLSEVTITDQGDNWWHADSRAGTQLMAKTTYTTKESAQVAALMRLNRKIDVRNDELREVLKTGLTTAERQELEDLQIQHAAIEDGDWSAPSMSPEQIARLRELTELEENRGNSTSFSEYTVDGKKGAYRELLLKLPDVPNISRHEQSTNEQVDGRWGRKTRYVVTEGSKEHVFDTNAEADKKYRELRAQHVAFTHESHWGATQNILAHIRASDRVVGDAKTLFIEELQSDWAQRARREGIGEQKTPLILREVNDDPVWTPPERRGETGLKEYIFDTAANDGGKTGFGHTEEEARADVYDKFGSLTQKGVPNAPFIHSTEAWLPLAIKRVVKYAVDNGYERVAFATGSQNAEHYSLEKAVSHVEWVNDAKSASEVMLTLKTGSNVTLQVNESGMVERAFASSRMDTSGLKNKPLADIVGQELAERVRNTPPDTVSKADAKDLTVGGEGMKGFYDNIVPKAVNKMLPKLGGTALTPQQMKIDSSNGHYTHYEVGPGAMTEHAILGVKADGSTVIVNQNMPSAQAAQAEVERMNAASTSGSQQLAFDVTDKMRQEVAGGVPLFLKNAVATDIGERVKGKWTDLRSLPLAMLGGRQIAEVYAKELPQLPQYQKLVQLMQAGVNDYAAKADKVASDWGKVKDDKQLANLMHDSTLAQIDAAKPYVQGDSESRYKELRAQWDKLTPEAKAIYTQARDMYEAHYTEVRQAIRDRISRAELSAPKKSEMLTRMDGQFFERIKGVYFPLARFGDYVLVVRDQAGKTVGVSRAETKREADTLRRDLKTQYGQGYTVSAVIKAAEFNAKRDAVGSEFLETLFKVLDQTGIGEDLQDDINQLVLSSMPDLSWAKHGIHRKGTAGFSQDARRAFAQNMFHGARYLQRVRFGDRLEGKLREAEKYVKGRNELTESVKEQQVMDEVRKRHELLMNPITHPWSSAATSFGFFFHLGLSPASALVNLTQTPMVAYPILAGKFGFGRSASALTKASADTMAAKNDLQKHLKGDEQKAVQRAIDEGTIDVTMAHDLAGIAQGNDTGIAWRMRPVMRAASYMFHHAERFNRQATFLAAYRMAREGGASSDAAFETASDLTIASHFDYSSSNRPRAMQGNVAKVVLQFKQYSQNMTFALGNNLRLALKGDKQAAKTLGGLLVMGGMAAGAMGVPLVAQILSLASMVGGSDDEPWDSKVALQNYLADAFSPKVAEVMMHGTSRLTPFDISGRVSLDLYKMWFPDVNEALEGQKAYESFATGLLGPVFGGIGVNYAKAFQQLSEGKYQDAMEALAPAVLRGPLKALRFAEEGAKTSKGLPVLEDVSPAGIGGQALGLRPAEVANAMEGHNAILSLDERMKQRRGQLLDQFARAAMAGDDTSSPLAAIQHWNESNPTRVIAGMHLQQAVANRTKRIAQSELGVYLPPKQRDLLQQGHFAEDR